MFPTGNEQTVINRFTKETDRPLPGPFSNRLDHILAVLLAKAYPKPEATALAQATITSLCKEVQRQTGRRVREAQRERWVSIVSRTKGFGAVLQDIAAVTTKHADQEQWIEAGLDGTRIAFKSNPGAVATRVILLTNKNTGSGAELLAMALHDNARGILVGLAWV